MVDFVSTQDIPYFLNIFLHLDIFLLQILEKVHINVLKVSSHHNTPRHMVVSEVEVGEVVEEEMVVDEIDMLFLYLGVE